MPIAKSCQLCFQSFSLVNTEGGKKISFATKSPSRHTAVKQSGLASSWADSICLSFSVGHMEPWAGNKVHGFGPHWSENSVSDFWLALKYLVLITATTFTLAGYCWNIIPTGAARLGRHTGDGSYFFTPALFVFFFFSNWKMCHGHSWLYRLFLNKRSRKLWNEKKNPP